MKFIGESPIDTYRKQTTVPSGLIPSRGKNTKYRSPDMSAPIKVRDIVIPVKVVDGQRFIDANAIARAMIDDGLTAQDLFWLMYEERAIWGHATIARISQGSSVAERLPYGDDNGNSG